MKKELFKIGEIAKLFHISISTLRHYDKMDLVSPEYIDEETGYRYYSVHQFECLNTIRYLRELDVPLEQIKQFVKQRGIAEICDILRQQKIEVEKKQRRLENIQKKIDNRLLQIENASKATLDTITIEEKEARRVVFLRKNFVIHSPYDLEYYIRELEQNEKSTAIFLGKIGVGLLKETMESKQYDAYDFVLLLLDEEEKRDEGITLLPKETCAVIRFQGSHEKAPIYYEKLLHWIEQNNYQVAGFSKEITMIDEGLTNRVEEYVTEIQIPVESIIFCS